MFSKEELERYARHFRLPGFGVEGQLRLKSSSVLVIGAGGLGCPALQYLAAAGVGRIGIVDGDRVDLSNLQRQVLFGTPDIGKFKAECAAEKLRQINPEISVVSNNNNITPENVQNFLTDYDVILDCTDNFSSRYLINDCCARLQKPNVFAAVFRFEGQISVFNLPQVDGSPGPQYRDVFPDPPPPGSVPDCAEGGILGVLPGILGSLQALEAIKVLTGKGKPLSGTILYVDGLSLEFRRFRIMLSPNGKASKQMVVE
jgi:sulfur-carrier protein adenylyltransferase/sulfurtransferase